MNYYAKRFFGQQGIVTDGLKLWLDASNPASYPGSGTTWFDLSGNGNNATMVNGVSWLNDSMFLDGINDYCVVNNENDLNLIRITIDVWIYPNYTNMTSYANVINKLTGNSASGWSLERDASSKKIKFWVGDGTISYPYIYNFVSSDLQGDKWSNIVAVFDGVNIKLFINSLLVSQKVSSMGILNGTQKLTIFKHGNSNYFFKEKSSDIRLYNRALTDSEIIQNYNATKSKYGL